MQLLKSQITKPQVPKQRNAKLQNSHSSTQTTFNAPLREAFLGWLGSDLQPLEHFPSLTNLVTALLSLAEKKRNKVILSLSQSPVEFAFLCSGKDVLVSIYETHEIPDVYCLNRPIDLKDFLMFCANLLLEEISSESATAFKQTERLKQAKKRIAEKALCMSFDLISFTEMLPIKRYGGMIEFDGQKNPLSFGHRVSIYGSSSPKVENTHHADHHALLFEGSLWAWVRGKRIEIANGPVMPAVTCMMTAIRKLLDSTTKDFARNFRVGTDEFWMGVRIGHDQKLIVTFNTHHGAQVSCNDLDTSTFALPILRLGSELLRTLSQVDRNQLKNLNVKNLKTEIRALRRQILETQKKQKGFINLNPDWLRVSNEIQNEDGYNDLNALTAPSSAASSDVNSKSIRLTPMRPQALRFSEAWQTEIDGLDPSSTFLCDDQIILSSSKAVLSLSKKTGNLQWIRESQHCRILMADSTLVQLNDGGQVDFCDIEDGEPIFSCATGASFSSFATAQFMQGPAMPPMFLLCDGFQTVMAVDARTGHVRWKYQNRERACLYLRRSGRVLLIASETGILDAIDMVSGEVVWKYVQELPFHMAPQVCGDVVLIASSHRKTHLTHLHGIDLYSGLRIWKRVLEECEMTQLHARDGRAWAILREGLDTSLAAIDTAEGTPIWAVPDPGIDQGGTLFCTSNSLVVHSPSSSTTGICPTTGEKKWERKLIDPVQDALPRVLEPRMHQGALYIPGSSVFVLCPETGQDISNPISNSLVPDWLRMDNRGWVFTAEEGGRISAFSPSPHLTLIHNTL